MGQEWLLAGFGSRIEKGRWRILVKSQYNQPKCWDKIGEGKVEWAKPPKEALSFSDSVGYWISTLGKVEGSQGSWSTEADCLN